MKRKSNLLEFVVQRHNLLDLILNFLFLTVQTHCNRLQLMPNWLQFKRAIVEGFHLCWLKTSTKFSNKIFCEWLSSPLIANSSTVRPKLNFDFFLVPIGLTLSQDFLSQLLLAIGMPVIVVALEIIALELTRALWWEKSWESQSSKVFPLPLSPATLISVKFQFLLQRIDCFIKLGAIYFRLSLLCLLCIFQCISKLVNLFSKFTVNWVDDYSVQAGTFFAFFFFKVTYSSSSRLSFNWLVTDSKCLVKVSRSFSNTATNSSLRRKTKKLPRWTKQRPFFSKNQYHFFPLSSPRIQFSF